MTPTVCHRPAGERRGRAGAMGHTCGPVSDLREGPSPRNPWHDRPMSKSARVPAAFAGCIAVVLVVAGCAGGGQGTGEAVAEPSAAEVAPAGPIPAGLEEFYTQQVQWGSCDGFSTDGSPLGDTLECAEVTVPNDYANPGGATAQIAVSRSKATGDKIGSLLVNPGGPGASGIGLASVADGTEIAERFDVIGFDPRGVGAS